MALTIHLVETWRRDPDPGMDCEGFEVGPACPGAVCQTDGHYLCGECEENVHRNAEHYCQFNPCRGLAEPEGRSDA